MNNTRDIRSLFLIIEEFNPQLSRYAIKKIVISQKFYEMHIRPLLINRTGNNDQPDFPKEGRIHDIPVEIVDGMQTEYAFVLERNIVNQ